MAQAEKLVSGFKPVTYDVSAQVKAIESFESTAVKQAQESATKLEAELKDLKETLNNIEGARPFDQLTTSDVIAARPEIAKTVEEMVKKGKWTLPGYEEKFGSTYRAVSWTNATRPRLDVNVSRPHQRRPLALYCGRGALGIV